MSNLTMLTLPDKAAPFLLSTEALSALFEDPILTFLRESCFAMECQFCSLLCPLYLMSQNL